MSMKRYSGLLKRPEILETVYSVESEDGGEANKTEKANEKNEVEEDTASIDKEVCPKPRLMYMKRMESETASYDWSTDSESLRSLVYHYYDHHYDMSMCRNMLSETDQSNCSSSGSTPNLSDSLAWSSSSVFSAQTRSCEDLR